MGDPWKGTDPDAQNTGGIAPEDQGPNETSIKDSGEDVEEYARKHPNVTIHPALPEEEVEPITGDGEGNPTPMGEPVPTPDPRFVTPAHGTAGGPDGEGPDAEENERRNLAALNDVTGDEMSSTDDEDKKKPKGKK